MLVSDAHSEPYSTSAQRRQRHKNGATKHLEGEITDLKSRLSKLESLIASTPAQHKHCPQPDEELSQNIDVTRAYSRDELLHIDVMLKEDFVVKQLNFEDVSPGSPLPSNMHTSPFQEISNDLDTLFEGLSNHLYEGIPKDKHMEELQCEPERPWTLTPHSAVDIAMDDPLIIEHEFVKHSLVLNMFRLDDFLLWKKRGYSDREAHTSVEDRFLDGEVAWKDGILQYSLNDDSDFDE